MPMRALPVAIVLALAGVSATGWGDEQPAAPATAAARPPSVAPDDPAVDLRGELASLLSDHAFQVTAAVASGARAGFDSDLYGTAEEGLTRSTDALVAALGPLFADGGRGPLERRLEQLDEMLLGYGRDQLAGGSQAPREAREVREVQRALTEILAGAAEELDATDLAQHLDLTTDELLRALELLGAGQPGHLAHTSAAAHRSRAPAAILADAVAAADDRVTGSPLAETARLHADLRALLEEDVHLSFGAIQTGLSGDFDSPAFAAASRTVDESATHFADRIVTIAEIDGRPVEVPPLDPPAAGASGEDSDDRAQVPLRRALRDLLRRHWQLLTLHAREAADDVPNVTTTEIEERLAAVTDAFATVLAERAAVARTTLLEPLDAADKALADAIDALAAGDPAAYDHLDEALAHMADAADALTDGIAR